jgi:hypothetical protein
VRNADQIGGWHLQLRAVLAHPGTDRQQLAQGLAGPLGLQLLRVPERRVRHDHPTTIAGARVPLPSTAASAAATHSSSDNGMRQLNE